MPRRGKSFSRLGILRKLVEKYAEAITKDCVEYCPKLEEAFDLRDDVIKGVCFRFIKL